MADLEELIAGVKEKLAVEQAARARYSMGMSRAGILQRRFERLHRYFAPVDGDQWPEDRALRPNKLHITANVIRAFCSVEARVLSILPRVSNKPPTVAPEDANKSEVVEELFGRYLEMSGWDVWMFDRELVKSVYGMSILKPFWNTDEKRPDVQVIEQPQNLLLGYGTSDHSVVDWAIYRYSISAIEAKLKYPDIEITVKKGEVPKVRRGAGDHTDPLNQKGGSVMSTLANTASTLINSVVPRDTDGESEKSQLEVWDYWYRRPSDGTICNAVLVQECCVELKEHPEYPVVPYLVTEHDHEPGSPEGLSTAESLVDIQMGINRAFSHYAQLVADNSGTAYQLTGENADEVPENIVPAEDEIIPAGSGNQILPIQRGVNVYNFDQLLGQYWAAAHKITGLPEVMFGEIPGTQTSGRAMAVQIEAAANRLDPKRRRSYEGLRQLLMFWGYMLEKINPKVRVSQRQEAEEGALATPTVTAQEIGIGEFIEGWQNWKIIAPEITPRDAIEHTNNVIAKVNAKLLPLSQAMDELGIENPQQMLALIEAEQSNASLNPAAVQAKLAAQLLVQQIEQAEAAANAQAAMQQASASETTLQQQAQQATPPAMEDMNQPATAQGSPPPPGAPSPGIGGQFSPLVRQTPGGESQALSQFELPGTRV